MTTIKLKLNHSQVESQPGSLSLQNSQKKQMLSMYVSKLSEELESGNRLRTAGAYQSFLNSFIKFNNNKDLALSQITKNLMKQYEIFLGQQGYSQNTISFYMRKIQAIYNQAIRECLISEINMTDKQQEIPLLVINETLEHTMEKYPEFI